MMNVYDAGALAGRLYFYPGISQKIAVCGFEHIFRDVRRTDEPLPVGFLPDVDLRYWT